MASASACPHYKDEICEVLDSAGKSGEFSSSGLADLCLPGLVIDEIGIIALPLLEVQAKNIIAVCSKQNNHDHKREQDKTENPQLDIRMDGIDENDKSLNDRNNRNCWQLESSKIKLENLVWHVKVEELVSKTLMELGFHDLENAYHQLDRMLLFERGGHLAPSRNHETDKINGLFAKLVILLPSDYSGGQLIVSHARKQNKYDFVAEESNYNFNYAAFYSDCKYEVEEVRSGYKLCLIYNIHYCGGGPLPCPQDYSQTELLECAISRWKLDTSGPSKLVYPLEHEYSEETLSFYNLKCKDRAVAELLKEFQNDSNQPDLEFYLSILTRQQTYTAMGSEKNFVLDELINEVFFADQIVSFTNICEVDEIEFEQSELLGEELDEIIYDEEEFEEGEDEEGAVVERLYHFPAIICWLKSKDTGNSKKRKFHCCE